MTNEKPAKFCSDCGNPRGDEPVCSKCGSGNITINPLPASCVGKTGKIGVVIEGDSPDGFGRQVEFSTPQGGSSNSTIDGSGVMDCSINGPINIGRPNESRVLKTLKSKLNKIGIVTESVPAEDARGEDSALIIEGQRIVVQMVTVPHDSSFWATQRRDGVVISETREYAIEILSGSIAKKSHIPPDQRSSTILVLDVSAIGAIVESSIMESVRTLNNKMFEELKFYAIWVVGPTASSTQRLWPRPDGE
ncbi:MAG: hypothetical protein JW746_09800 [Candidatus Krumholzibacteriota bacterium]|nr:hypothetical protein [Candidatus Krumholzibacteriota bacterium]